MGHVRLNTDNPSSRYRRPPDPAVGLGRHGVGATGPCDQADPNYNPDICAGWEIFSTGQAPGSICDTSSADYNPDICAGYEIGSVDGSGASAPQQVQTSNFLPAGTQLAYSAQYTPSGHGFHFTANQLAGAINNTLASQHIQVTGASGSSAILSAGTIALTVQLTGAFGHAVDVQSSRASLPQGSTKSSA